MFRRIKNTARKKMKKNSPLRNFLERINLWGWQTFPSVFSWSVSKDAVGFNLTYRCNLSCLNCNRSIKQAPAKEDVSPEQVENFVKESFALNRKWSRITISGGEATLHPKLFEILEILKQYKDAYPSCRIPLLTNGHGNTVKTIVSRLPKWINVVNSSKISSFQQFTPFSLAPIDQEKYKHANFSRGCAQIEICGFMLSRYGYYPCGPAANIDRIFGFDLGFKSLSSINDRDTRKRLKVLCAYCGHYRDNFGEKRNTAEVVSKSWEEAYRNYKINPPILSLYNP